MAYESVLFYVHYNKTVLSIPNATWLDSSVWIAVLVLYEIPSW